MQRSGVVRCTATLTGVGTSLVQSNLTPVPPKRGKILFVSASFSGPATQINTLNLRENAAGSVRIQYTNEAAAFQDAPGGIPFDAADLKVQAATDDGTAASTVTVTVDIEVG